MPPSRRLLLASGLVYLGVSLLVWWNVWSHHPTSTTTCGCADPSLFTWFLAWPAHAILHGQNPFYSTALFYPSGVDLLSNTSVLAIGTVLAPVTWIFGPIATLNVALLLSPVATALAMCALLRRWTRWSPAAFIGGLAYGFAPFFLLNLTGGYLMISMAAIPPLIVLCLDELLVRQVRSRAAVGVLLGILVSIQFFVGTESLLLIVFCAVIALVLLVGYAAARSPGELRSHLPHALGGLGWSLVVVVVLLSYPLWFALAGPAHLSGRIWPTLELQHAGTNFRQVLLPTAPQINGFSGFDWNHGYGGYQGPVLSAQYFGIGIVAVLVGGTVAFRRDKRLWVFATLTVVTLLLSLGATGRFLPWNLALHLPEFENVVPERLLAITWFTTSILLGLIVDHTYRSLDGWLVQRRDQARGAPSRVPSRWIAASAAALVAAAALAEPIAYLSQGIPFTAVAVVPPTWFEDVAPHLTDRQVVYVIPSPSSLRDSAVTWQAVDDMTFSMVGGPGPGDLVSRAGSERPGATVLIHASQDPTTVPTIDTITPQRSTSDVRDVRSALLGWGVTMVVVPDEPQLPEYTRVPSVTVASALVTAATGERPAQTGHAWVWTDVQAAIRSHRFATTELAPCVRGLALGGAPSVDAATGCVLDQNP